MSQTDTEEPESGETVVRTLYELMVFIGVAISIAYFFNLFELNVIANVILSLLIAALFHHEIIDNGVKK